MNLLYTMEDVAVYGYITPLKVKIIIALALTDSVVRDADVLTVRSLLSSLACFFSSEAFRYALCGPWFNFCIVDLSRAAHRVPSGGREPLPQAQRTHRRLQRPRYDPPCRWTEMAHVP